MFRGYVCLLTEMAAKTKVARLESEIEKCRSEGNWAKALDLTRQVSSKSQTLGNGARAIKALGNRCHSCIFHVLLCTV